MIATTGSRELAAYLREWEEYFQARVYSLAQHEAREAAEAYPLSSEAWFAFGLAQLAATGPSQAAVSLKRALDLVTSRQNHTRTLSSAVFRNLEPCARRLLQAIERKQILTLPPNPYEWLSDPEVIGTAKGLTLQSKPIGRTQALLSPDRTTGTSDATAMLRLGVLGRELPIERVPRDSMSSLLGSDRNIKIAKPDLRIMDDSIHIIDPALRTKGMAKVGSRPPTQESSPAPPRSAVRPAFPEPASPEPVKSAPPMAAARGSQWELQKPGAKPPTVSGDDPWTVWETELEKIAADGNSAEAFRRLDEAISRFPKSSRLLELKAETLRRFGRHQEAAKYFLTTYCKAREAGSEQRAEKVYRQILELGKEDGDVLMDLATVMAAFGSAGMATAVGKMAADLYRRRNDRPKLLEVLHRIHEWKPDEQAILEELRQLGGAAIATAKHLAEQPGKASGAADSFETMYPRTAPPKPGGHRPQAQPRVPAGFDSSAPPPPRQFGQSKTRLPATSNAGFGFLFAAIIVFVITLASKSAIPAFVGWLIVSGYLGNEKKADHPRKLAQAASVLFFLSWILGIVLK
ncbi:hypothetical protein HZA57_03495 [Candidatus Poribacteria bacterium]|nr:hypothetical protein [Candidatus Poribacteria bacterium]